MTYSLAMKLKLGGREQETQIDDEDYERAVARGPWHLNPKNGYAMHNAKRLNGRPLPGERQEYLHRFVLGLGVGDSSVDHINGDRLDNRKANLRLVDKSQNLCNAKRRSDNTTGCKGISFSKKDQKWHAYVNLYGKRRNLGFFLCKLEAFIVVCRAREELHGEFTHHG